jgi:hypothetical protein
MNKKLQFVEKLIIFQHPQNLVLLGFIFVKTFWGFLK